MTCFDKTLIRKRGYNPLTPPSPAANDLVAVLDHLHAGVLAVGDGVDEAVTAELSSRVFGFPASSEGGCLLDFCALRGADHALRAVVDFALDNM